MRIFPPQTRPQTSPCLLTTSHLTFPLLLLLFRAPHERALLGRHSQSCCIFSCFVVSLQEDFGQQQQDVPTLKSTAKSRICSIASTEGLKTILGGEDKEPSTVVAFGSLKELLGSGFSGLAMVRCAIVEVCLGPLKLKRGHQVTVTTQDFKACSVVRCMTCKNVVRLASFKIEGEELFCSRCGYETPMSWSWSSLSLILQDPFQLHQLEIRIDPRLASQVFPNFKSEWLAALRGRSTPRRGALKTSARKQAKTTSSFTLDSPAILPCSPFRLAYDPNSSFCISQVSQAQHNSAFSPTYFRHSTPHSVTPGTPSSGSEDQQSCQLLHHLEGDVGKLLGHMFELRLRCHTLLDENLFIQGHKFALDSITLLD